MNNTVVMMAITKTMMVAQKIANKKMAGIVTEEQ